MDVALPLREVISFLEECAPPELAEDWDNVGLLLGREDRHVSGIMTCLTLTEDCIAEAIRQRASLIVTHHPLPFRPLKRITSADPVGRSLLDLAEAKIAVYSPHTAFDSAVDGINQSIATAIGLQDVVPLRSRPTDRLLGAGRKGKFPEAITGVEIMKRLQACMRMEGLQAVGDLSLPRTQLGVACGSAGEFLKDAGEASCDVFVTGETNFHTALDARRQGVLLLLPGHYATERFAVERLADRLAKRFQPLACWASEVEQDPLTWHSCKQTDG